MHTHYPHTENDTHMALALSESAAANSTSSWEKWIDAAEKELGHDVDGTQWIDGYSIDDALECFESGFTVGQYVDRVQRDKESVARGEYITEISCQSFKGYDREGDETQHDDIILYCGNATQKQVDAYVKEHYPAERCQHEYDCCGRWYANSPSYKVHGPVVVMRRSYLLNI